MCMKTGMKEKWNCYFKALMKTNRSEKTQRQKKDSKCGANPAFLGCFCFFTFHISIPIFSIRQVHVDICTQLWSAGGEHTIDFVLIKSSFLQTAHESSLFQLQAIWCHTHTMQLSPDHTTLISASLHFSRPVRNCVGLDSNVWVFFLLTLIFQCFTQEN